MNKLVKNFRYAILLVFIFLPKLIPGTSPALMELLDDIKLYKFVEEGETFHAGDLFEHSMWVYYAALEMIDKKSIYISNLNLSKDEENVFLLAALLHDIGKAGRTDLFTEKDSEIKYKYKVHKNDQGKCIKIEYFPDFKQEHPLIGFEYIATPFLKKNTHFKQRSFMLHSGDNFDFGKMFGELKISDENRKLIAILIGMHYEFGAFCVGKIKDRDFLNKIQELADAVSFNKNKITKKIFIQSMFIQIADVMGLSYVDYFPQTELFPSAHKIDAIHNKCDIQNPFKKYGYEQSNDNLTPPPFLKMQNLLTILPPE